MRLLLTFALVLLLASEALAQRAAGGGTDVGRVERHLETVYYDVEGKTVAELAQALQARGPQTDGERFYGLTQWQLNAEYQWIETNAGCEIAAPVVRVAVTMTLPRWAPPRGTPAELVGAWNRFYRALEQHEHEHRRLAEEAADAIRWELATLRLPSCAQAEARAQQRVADIVQDYNRRNAQYDAQTRHGITEGAVWPPRRRIGG